MFQFWRICGKRTFKRNELERMGFLATSLLRMVWKLHSTSGCTLLLLEVFFVPLRGRKLRILLFFKRCKIIQKSIMRNVEIFERVTQLAFFSISNNPCYKFIPISITTTIIVIEMEIGGHKCFGFSTQYKTAYFLYSVVNKTHLLYP